MVVRFRDNLGFVQVTVDEYGISFLDGYAYFGDGETEYKIEVENLTEILPT